MPVAALVRYFPAAHDEQDAEEGPLNVPAVHAVQLLVVYIGVIVCWRRRGCWGGVVLVLDSFVCVFVSLGVRAVACGEPESHIHNDTLPLCLPIFAGLTAPTFLTSRCSNC